MPLDGDTVQSGSLLVEWAIRSYHVDDAIKYDWIIDDGVGGYSESDWYYDSVEAARKGLGLD